MINKDAIIVGAGPAGSACAWRLNQLGINCLLLDQADFPRPKPCAGWITPQVFELLAVKHEDYPHSLTHFTSFEISLRKIKFRLPTHQYAIRRVEFDHWMLQRANVEFHQHQVTQIEKTPDGFLVDGQYHARYLVGAGGTNCPVRRAFFPSNPSTRLKGLVIAKEEEFKYPITDNRCHLWFFKDGLPGYAWYVPKTGGYLNVGIGGSASKIKSSGVTLNQHWNLFIEYLSKQALVNDHHFKPLGYSYYRRQKTLRLQSGNVLLIGDALGLATLDMGEGIGPAIYSGLMAAKAISQGTPYTINPIPRYSFPSIIRIRKSII